MLAELATLPAVYKATNTTITDAHALVQNTGDEPLIKGMVRMLSAGVVDGNASPDVVPRPIGDYLQYHAHSMSHVVFHTTDRLPGAAQHAIAATSMLNHGLNHSLGTLARA